MLTGLVVLGGCATLDDLWPLGQKNTADATAKVMDERALESPLPNNHYVLSEPEQSVIGEPQVVYARADDTFSDLARTYGLGYDELVAANPDVDPWLPGEGTAVLLPTQFILPDVKREGIVLNIASKRLFYFPPVTEGQAQIVKTYPIGIGRVGWETPLGLSKVIDKAVDPTWWVPASVRKEHAEMGDPLPSVVPPGPDNPLGSRVLRLDMPGYLIHGTNQPYGVGMRVSHGCVRLYPENIEFLYELVAIGERVEIINEPYLIGQSRDQWFVEVHEPLEDDAVTADQRLANLLATIEEKIAADRIVSATDAAVATVAIESGVPTALTGEALAGVMARSRYVHNTVQLDPNSPTLSEVREMMDEVMLEDDSAEASDTESM